MPRLVFILGLICALMCAPLCANSVTFAKPSEARATISIIRDRLREKYKANGSRIDARWKLRDVASDDELNGSFLEAGDYRLSFPADSPDLARIECAKAFPLRDGPLVLITNLRTGENIWQEPPIDDGKETFKKLTMVGLIALVCSVPLLLGWVVMRKQNLATQDRIGAWLAATGFWLAFSLFFLSLYLINFQRAWERPPDPFFGAGLYLADFGVFSFAVGLLVIRPRTMATLGLHFLAALVGGLIASAVAYGTDTYRQLWLAFCIGVVVLIVATSVKRFRRAYP